MDEGKAESILRTLAGSKCIRCGEEYPGIVQWAEVPESLRGWRSKSPSGHSLAGVFGGKGEESEVAAGRCDLLAGCICGWTMRKCNQCDTYFEHGETFIAGWQSGGSGDSWYVTHLECAEAFFPGKEGNP